MRFLEFEGSALVATALVISACGSVPNHETPVTPISPSASPCEPGQVDIGTVGPDSNLIPNVGDVMMLFIDGEWVQFKNVEGHVCSRFVEPKFGPPIPLVDIAV